MSKREESVVLTAQPNLHPAPCEKFGLLYGDSWCFGRAINCPTTNRIILCFLGDHAGEDSEDSVAPLKRVGCHINVKAFALQLEE